MIALEPTALVVLRRPRGRAGEREGSRAPAARRFVRGAGSRRSLAVHVRNCGSPAARSSPTLRRKSASRARTRVFAGELASGKSLGARYYAPWLGRWTTADPLGLQAGLNLYLYGRASPVVMVDPNGMDTVSTEFRTRTERPGMSMWDRARVVMSLLDPISGTKSANKLENTGRVAKGVGQAALAAAATIGNDPILPGHDPSKPTAMGVLKQSVAESWGQGDNLAESARNVANVFNPFYQFPKEAQAAAKAYDAGQLEQAGAHGFAAAGAAAGALAPAGALAKIFASGSGGGLMPALAVAGGGTETAAAGTAVAAGGGGLLEGVAGQLVSLMSGGGFEDRGEVWSPPRPGDAYPRVDFAKSKDLFPVKGKQQNIVKIEYTGSIEGDYAAANKAGNFGGGSALPVGPGGEQYIWHHLDYDPTTNTGTVQLVRRSTHQANQPHSGGISDWKQAHPGQSYPLRRPR